MENEMSKVHENIHELPPRITRMRSNWAFVVFENT